MYSIDEALKKYEYKEIFKNARFGLELECELDSNSIGNSLRTKLGMGTTVDLLNKFYDETTLELKGHIQSTFPAYSNDKKVEILRAILTIKSVFDSIEFPPFFGEYGDGRSEDGWRVETDGSLSASRGVEIITPLNRGEACTQEYILNQVPRLIKALKILGFNGNDNTGLHVHVSHEDNVNSFKYQMIVTDLRRKKYSNFAIASYLSSRESDFFFQQGDYARTKSYYSKNLLNSLKSVSINNMYDSILTSFRKRDRLSPFNLTSPTNVIVKFHATNFMYEPVDQFDSVLVDSLNSYSKAYLDKLFTGSHYSDISARSKTVELRGLGGEEAFDIMDKPTEVSKILRSAVTQLYPLINLDSIKLRDIQKATFNALKETINHIYHNNVISGTNHSYSQLKTNNVNISTVEVTNDSSKDFISFEVLKSGVLPKVTRVEKGIGKTVNGYNLKSNARKVEYMNVVNRETVPEKFIIRDLSANSVVAIDNVSNINRRQIVQQEEPVSNSDLTVTLGQHTFIAKYMIRPSIRSNSLTFEYGDDFRYIHRFPTPEQARETFRLITTVSTAAARGASLNPNLRGYYRVSDLNQQRLTGLNSLNRDNERAASARASGVLDNLNLSNERSTSTRSSGV